jgi:hypothetical protein
MWNLKYIPTTLITYFGAPKLSYLRYLTLYSFRKFNPDWKIKLFKPKYLTENLTWNTHENKEKYDRDLCYFNKLEELNIEIEEVDFNKFGLSNDMSEVHKSDFFRLQYLANNGGIWTDMDIIFFKSMDKANFNLQFLSKLESIFCITTFTNTYNFHSIGFLGSKPKNEPFAFLYEKAKLKYDKNRYESIGSDLYIKEFPSVDFIEKVFKNKVINLTMDQVYHLNSFNIDKIYNNSLRYQDVYNRGIGCHWYAGAPVSNKWENILDETNYNLYDNNLTKLIEKVYE